MTENIPTQSEPNPSTTLDLRIIPTPTALPHEQHDQQRINLLQGRLSQEDILKNPPIVTPATDTHPNAFIILDGANRALAINNLQIPHLLVQVVPYHPPHVELHTWNHLFTTLPHTDLLTRLESITEIYIQSTTTVHAQAELARRAILAYCVSPTGSAFTISGGGMDLQQRTALLQAIVNTYIHDTHLQRTNLTEPAELTKTHPNMTAALIFPHYEPAEVIDIAQSGFKIPPGITRHIVHGRALRVNYPLKQLRASQPLEQKNRDLHDWILASFSTRHIRYYAESTYLFDE